MKASPRGWIRSLLRTRAHKTVCTGRLRTTAAVPRLESLEDRLTPSVSATGTNFNALEGVPVNALAATFNDSATTTVTPSMKATISWGDGSTSAGSIVHLGPASSHTFTVNASKTYREEGHYPVQVTISDGSSSAVTHGVGNVTDAPLISTSLPLNATEGVGFNGTVATLRDLDANATPGMYTVTITWGDGQLSRGTVVPATGKGTFTLKGVHTYASAGIDFFSVSIADVGGSKITTQGSAHVADAPLQATGQPIGVAAGTPFSGVVATFTDPDPNANLSLYKATIAWGDGHTSTGTIAAGSAKGLFTISGSNTYAAAGIASVAVTITDKGGSSVTTHANATVTSPSLAALGSPVSATEGTAFSTVVASFSDVDLNSNAALYTATITWGDGHTSAGTVAAGASAGTFTVSGGNTYAAFGSYPVSVKIADSDGGSATASSTATVKDAALTPGGVAFQTTEGAAFSGLVATFTDPAPAAVGQYTATITWGDGHTSTGTVTAGTGNTFTVSGGNTYAAAGSYAVSVAISDKGGSSATAKGTATVLDASLSGIALAVQSTEAAAFSGVVATFSDPDPAAAATLYTATITWGDGHTSAGTISAAAGKGNFLVSGGNTYATAGSYSFSVQISDKGGASTTATGTATVADLPLTATGVPPGATEGTAFVTTVATFSDADPGATAALYTATITWGDGHTSTGTVTSTGPGAFAVSGGNTYAAAGSYSVSVKISDKGGSTATATATATASDASLTASPATVAATEGLAFSGPVATFTDADPGATAALYTATITWGDGHTSAGTVTGSALTGFTVSGGNTYAAAGPYGFSVQISDKAGASATATGTVTVQDQALTTTGLNVQTTENASFSGVVATFNDPDPAATATLYTATITWGDGHTSAGTVAAAAGKGTFTVSGGNTYVAAGSFPVSVQISDKGGATITATGTAVVQDAALTGTSMSVSATHGSPFTGALATFSDADSGTKVAGQYTVTITWGDGNVSAGTVTSGPAGGFTVSGSNTYASAGSYTATVHIVDAGGGTIDVQDTVTVV